MTKVLIDNGHGTATSGKRSPDGRLIEGRYAREIARRLGEELEERGVPYALITPEMEDTPLATRVYRANTYHRQHHDGTVFISLHSDAAPGSGWHSARGFAVWTSRGATKADKLAECIYEAAETCLSHYIRSIEKGVEEGKYSKSTRALRMDKSDGDKDYEADFYVLKHTIMPAVLVEMFFHDNRDDVEWALSPEGKSAIVNALLDGICKFIGA